MKKLNLNLEGIGQMLTKDEMKRVVGGYETPNPNCAGDTSIGTWYCCGAAGSGSYTYKDNTTCDTMANHNSCSKLTNSVSRC